MSNYSRKSVWLECLRRIFLEHCWTDHAHHACDINTFFTASVLWGTIGPVKVFGRHGQYAWLLLGFPSASPPPPSASPLPRGNPQELLHPTNPPGGVVVWRAELEFLFVLLYVAQYSGRVVFHGSMLWVGIWGFGRRLIILNHCFSWVFGMKELS